MKNLQVTYTVNNLPSVDNRQKLSPQLTFLCQAIDKVKSKENVAVRSEIFKAWSDLCKSTDNTKVFASHIHHFIAFGFIGKMTIAKVVTKEQVLALIAKLTETEKAELLTNI
jgi:hypothetical protein